MNNLSLINAGDVLWLSHNEVIAKFVVHSILGERVRLTYTAADGVTYLKWIDKQKLLARLKRYA